tara:strand:- start:13 stop:654 length:642 start_codon:yes stop_codon:yes gene_type:complete
MEVVANPIKPGFRVHLFLLFVSLVILAVTCTATGSSDKISWRTFNGDIYRSGHNLNEELITRENVGDLKLSWVRLLPDIVDCAPIFLADAGESGQDLIIMNSRSGTLMAYDAMTGNVVWSNNIAAPVSGGCEPIGLKTKSTPVVDEEGVYLYAYRLDGAVHRYNASTGEERVGGGFPAVTTINLEVPLVSYFSSLSTFSVFILFLFYLYFNVY